MEKFNHDRLFYTGSVDIWEKFNLNYYIYSMADESDGSNFRSIAYSRTGRTLDAKCGGGEVLSKRGTWNNIPI